MAPPSSPLLDLTDCPACDGSGIDGLEQCVYCDGDGDVTVEDASRIEDDVL